MSEVSVFLDTSVLIALAHLKGKDRQIFKKRLEAGNIELSVSHIQLDEMSKQVRDLQNFKQVSPDQALKSFGIRVSWKDPTKGTVCGVSRCGYSMVIGEELGKIYDELREEISSCMHGKKNILNIARDALIAITSLNHDYFVVSDKCLHKSWLKVIENNMQNRKTLKAQGYTIPKVEYTKTDAKAISERIVNFVRLSS